MAFSYLINPESQTILTRISGSLNYEELTDYFRELQANAGFRPTYAELVDLQEVTEVKISTTEITQLAKLRIFDSTAKRALVAKSDLTFGVCRMFVAFCAFGGEHNIRVFHEIGEGRKWVGGPDDSAGTSAARLAS